MSIRTFRDSSHVEWTVWEIGPDLVASLYARQSVMRRQAEANPEALGGRGAEGWLVFESPSEIRRLSPVPARWGELPDSELERLCTSATVDADYKPPAD